MKRSLSLLLCVLVLLTGISGLVFAADSGSVNIADPTLAAAVRQELGLSPSDSLTLAELKRLEVLDVTDQNIVTFAGLESAVNLRRLNAANCRLQDATALAGLTSLEALDLSGNTLTDLSFLSDAHQLQQLYLRGTSLANVNGIEKVASTLLVLDISQNQVTDFSPLAGLSQLTMLDVSDNPAADLSPVTGFGKLGVLYANGLSLSSASGLTNLSGLQSLQLNNNALADLSPLLSLEHLKDLDVTANPLDFTSDQSAKDAIAVLESKGVLVQYDPPEEEKPAPSNKLKSLSVKDVSFDRPFDPNGESDTYTCTVPYETASLTITAVAEDAEATVQIYNNALVPGETTDVVVAVSRDGVETRKYTISAAREGKAPDPVDPPTNKLTALAVDGVALDRPFDPQSENLVYSCTVPYEMTTLSVVAKAEHPDAVILIYNNTLLAGKTTDVTVAVSLAGVGTRKYTIRATREEAPLEPNEPSSSAPESSSPSSSSQSPSSSEASSSEPSSAPSSSSQPDSSSAPSSSSAGSSSTQPNSSSQEGSSSSSASSQSGGSSSGPDSSSSPSDSHAPSPSDPGASTPKPPVNTKPSAGSSSSSVTEEPDETKSYSTKLASLTVLGTADSSYRQTVAVEEDSILLSCTVPSTVSMIDIDATALDEQASISVIGRELPPGKTVPVFIGVSHPELRTRFYILLVTREAEETTAAAGSLPSNVSSTRLKDLTVAEASLSTAYNMLNPFETYSCTVSAETDALTIQATPADEKATFTIENNDLKPGATTSVRITVSREGLPSRHYEIKVTRPALPAKAPVEQPDTRSNRLSELEVAGVTFDYPFRAQNRGETYTCTVPYDMSSLDIKAVAADPDATVTILNNVLVIGQTTTVSVKVQRAGLPTLYYSILATRPASPGGGTGTVPAAPDSSSTSNKLKELSVRGVDFDFPFRENNPGETYACTVPASMSSLDITAVPVDPGAKVTILFNSLEPGKTTNVVIAVAPVSGDTLYYTIRATRPASRAVPSGAPPTLTATAPKALPAQVTPVTLSGHSNKLKSLEIEGATFVGVPFRPTNSGEDYDIIAPAGATELKITAVPMDSEASYKVYNNKLTPGTACVVSIGVSHPGMETLFYTLNVTVPAGGASSSSSSKAPAVNTGVNALKSLSVEEAAISPVYNTQDTMRIYYCTVPHHVESLTIEAVPFEADAQVTITGNNLVAGQETAVTVSVARRGMTTQNYIIMATREEGYVPESGASSLPESSLLPSEPLEESSAPSLPEESSQESASSKPPANSSRSALGISIAILLISAAVAVTVVFLNQRPNKKKKFPRNKE